ncbi:NRAMP family divalent metal transporter [Nevskia soli]|uniref:NRAMP family divalent metal transporter n=1 Tax=Nevskia soli TaxID=418856 RepID=UPI000AD0F281|nr:divalent metal cation transporter [Nevskia soli]
MADITDDVQSDLASLAPDPPLAAGSKTSMSISRGIWKRLGPGLITGASDDDPSGIATYSQVGAQYGYGMAWTMIFSYPLMAAMQEISARIGRVTGNGIAGNIRQHYPPALLRTIVCLLLVANIINLGADLGAMGDAVQQLTGGSPHIFVAIFAVACACLEIFSRYDQYVPILKWSTFSLLAYVATVMVVKVDWHELAVQSFVPTFSWHRDYIVGVVAVFGTTLSPYLFFWQASEESEDERTTAGAEPLLTFPSQAATEFRRIRIDTYAGMGYSNIIALCIIVTTAATLHAHGITDIQTSAQAAEALRPIAGRFASTVFAIGIVGTGLLAIPVLAGSASYAVGEAMQWPVGLGRRPSEAKAFYGVIACATLLGFGINFVGFNPIKALFWTAVINGVVAVPLMIVIMLMTAQSRVMGPFILPRALLTMGWLATGIMATTVAAMFWTWLF